MDDEKDDISLEVVPGQICYDELEYPPLVEEEEPNIVLDGQIGINDITITKSGDKLKQNKIPKSSQPSEKAETSYG